MLELRLFYRLLCYYFSGRDEIVLGCMWPLNYIEFDTSSLEVSKGKTDQLPQIWCTVVTTFKMTGTKGLVLCFLHSNNQNFIKIWMTDMTTFHWSHHNATNILLLKTNLQRRPSKQFLKTQDKAIESKQDNAEVKTNINNIVYPLMMRINSTTLCVQLAFESAVFVCLFNQFFNQELR